MCLYYVLLKEEKNNIHSIVLLLKEKSKGKIFQKKIHLQIIFMYIALRDSVLPFSFTCKK